MDNQTVPPYQATAPGSTQPMVYTAEKDNAMIQQPQPQSQLPVTQNGTHDFIERVEVEQNSSAPAQHDPNMYEQGPEPAYVVPLEKLGDSPVMIACPHCKHRAMTRVSKEDSSMTTICGAVLCLFCICATCLPCLCGWFQDVDHYCTNCNKKVVHRRHDGGNEVIYPVPTEMTTTYPLAQPKPAVIKG